MLRLPGLAQDIAIVNKSATTPTAGAGLRIERGHGARLTRVHTAGFWNNVSFEQSEYANITDCIFMEPVNFGLWTRNLVVADQGDMTVSGTAFSYSGSVNRTGASAIKWESGGGLKFIGSKINMGPRGSGGKLAIGIDQAVANEISTSVFTVSGSSIENTTSVGILVRAQGTTGSLGKLAIDGNEFSANGVAIDVEGASATVPLKSLAVTGNVIDGSRNAIYLKNVDGFVIGSNVLLSTANGAHVDTGCRDGVVGRQAVVGSTSNVIRNDSSTLFSDHTTGP
jgi:hypothetical protein